MPGGALRSTQGSSRPPSAGLLAGAQGEAGPALLLPGHSSKKPAFSRAQGHSRAHADTRVPTQQHTEDASPRTWVLAVPTLTRPCVPRGTACSGGLHSGNRTRGTAGSPRPWCEPRAAAPSAALPAYRFGPASPYLSVFRQNRALVRPVPSDCPCLAWCSARTYSLGEAGTHRHVSLCPRHGGREQGLPTNWCLPLDLDRAGAGPGCSELSGPARVRTLVPGPL